jgi:hypothetical protein
VFKDDLDAAEYLRPKDVTTLPQRRGREPSTFYPRLLAAFVSSGEAAAAVDVGKIGRKPETVRSALAKAIKTSGQEDKVRVSLIGEEVVLRLR